MTQGGAEWGGERTLELACIKGVFVSSFTPVHLSKNTINRNNNRLKLYAKRYWLLQGVCSDDRLTQQAHVE